MPKLQQAKGRSFITLPRELVAKKQWKKGIELLLILNDQGNIEIVP